MDIVSLVTALAGLTIGVFWMAVRRKIMTAVAICMLAGMLAAIQLMRLTPQQHDDALTALPVCVVIGGAFTLLAQSNERRRQLAQKRNQPTAENDNQPL